MNTIIWVTALGISACCSEAQTVITSGGAYSGYYTSEYGRAAIEVATAAHVTIYDSVFSCKGNGIIATVPGANLTVVNCQAIARNPNVPYAQKGFFIYALSNFQSLTVYCNTFDGWNEVINCNNPVGSPWTGAQVQILYNRVRNLDARISNGSGGYWEYTNNPWFGQESAGGTFVSLMHVIGMVGQISWNDIENTPGTTQNGDQISIYGSSGQYANHFSISNNFICGALPVTPIETTYTPCCIVLDDPITNGTEFIDVVGNILIRCSQGINLASGNYNTASGNIIVYDGLDNAGNVEQVYPVGLNCTRTNSATGNSVGVVYKNGGVHNFYGNVRASDNTALPSPTLSAETSQIAAWWTAVKTNNLTIGAQ